MIKLTRFNGNEFFVNVDLMEFIESTPDTMITLTTGKKLIVKEAVDEVVEKVIDFKSRAFRQWEVLKESQTDS